MTTSNDTEIFVKQVNMMIDNLEKLPQLGDVNLVFEGGSLNGFYLLGVALFLKELERRGLMRVVKISGTSIGAYVGFHYLNDTLMTAYKRGMNAKHMFKERLNMSSFKNTLTYDMSGVDIGRINSKLFVTYYDVYPERKRRIQCDFADVDDLYDAILSSAYLPVLMDGGNSYYVNRKHTYRIDGGIPHIFDLEVGVKTLYVKLSQLGKIRNMFMFRGEKSGRCRVCEGILSSYKFFLYGETGSDMCSWVGNWSTIDWIELYVKQVTCTIFIMGLCVVKWLWDWLFSRIKIDEYRILAGLWEKNLDVLRDTLIYFIN